MKEYSIYKNPDGLIIAVKNGYSLPAFFFTWIWCLVKKLYSNVLVFLLLTILSGLLYHVNEWLYFFLLLGFNGNKYIKQNLLKYGYVFRETVRASSSTTAVVLHRTAILPHRLLNRMEKDIL